MKLKMSQELEEPPCVLSNQNQEKKRRKIQLLCDSPFRRLAIIPFWRLAIEEALNNRPRLAETDQTNHLMFLTRACASKSPSKKPRNLVMDSSMSGVRLEIPANFCWSGGDKAGSF